MLGTDHTGRPSPRLPAALLRARRPGAERVRRVRLTGGSPSSWRAWFRTSVARTWSTGPSSARASSSPCTVSALGAASRRSGRTCRAGACFNAQIYPYLLNGDSVVRFAEEVARQATERLDAVEGGRGHPQEARLCLTRPPTTRRFGCWWTASSARTCSSTSSPISTAAAIGTGTRVGAFVEISSGVSVGDRCKISSHSYICDGVAIGDGVFIGHGVVFVNDKYPRAVNADGSLQTGQDWELLDDAHRRWREHRFGRHDPGRAHCGRGRHGRRRRGSHPRRRPGHGGGGIPGAPAGEKPPLSRGVVPAA